MHGSGAGIDYVDDTGGLSDSLCQGCSFYIQSEVGPGTSVIDRNDEGDEYKKKSKNEEVAIAMNFDLAMNRRLTLVTGKEATVHMPITAMLMQLKSLESCFISLSMFLLQIKVAGKLRSSLRLKRSTVESTRMLQ